jgi:hypothetical protein
MRTLEVPRPAARTARAAPHVGALRWLAPSALLAVVLGIYLANGRVVESTDTYGNELLPIAILDYHTLTFDPFYAGPAAATTAEAPYRLSPEQPSERFPWWFRQPRQHIVSLYPIAPGLLNTPAFWVARLLGQPIEQRVVGLTHVTTASVAALSVVCMYLALAQVCRRRRAALFLSLGFAFGTAVWSINSRSLYQHGPALLFITAALAALLSGRRALVAGAGLLLGLAVVTRPTSVLIAAALALFVVRRHRPAAWAFFGLAAVPAVLLAWYSWVYWGSPLALGQGQGLDGFGASRAAVASLGLLLSPNRGLLVFSPIFIFSLVGAAYLLLRGRGGPPIMAYLIWSSLAEYVLYTFWSNWWGGHTFGYRLLIEVVPALMLVLGACWERLILPRLWLRALFLLALLASVSIHGLGATVSPCGFDDVPNNVDLHPERLWDVADGELARCTAQAIAGWRAAAARWSG